jgi:ribonuclease HII
MAAQSGGPFAACSPESSASTRVIIHTVTDLLRYERECWGRGYGLVAGVDEAGRGALAGPMVAAAVILPRDFDPNEDPLVRDSKSMSPTQLEAAYPRILAEAIASCVIWVTASAIDDASEKGEFDVCHVDLLRNTIRSLSPQPTHVLIDYYEVPGLSMSSQWIAHGDAVSASIAAASVVAKVTRDRMMTDFGAYFPGYGFERHKGYGAEEHSDALAKDGPSPIHRRSNKAVRPYLARSE